MNDWENFRAVKVLKEAILQNRIPHGILLHGANPDGLESIALTLAQTILNTTSPAYKHPDFHTLRPSNKMRQIGADETRELSQEIYKAPFSAERKVAVIYDADRMNTTAANAFLKTLEEPPEDTTLFLLTTKPYGLLPTIRSRCFLFKLPLQPNPIEDPDWLSWVEQYHDWLGKTQAASLTADDRATLIMMLYGLIVQLESIMEKLSEATEENSEMPTNLSSEEKDALSVGHYKRIRQQILTGIEIATRDFVLQDTQDAHLYSKWITITAELEKIQGLLETNLNESAALEAFFLESLRIWTTRE